MPDRNDDIDGWLSERIDPLPPPPGTFELIKRRARRRKYRRLAVGAGVAAVIVAAAVTVPQVVSLPVVNSGSPAAHVLKPGDKIVSVDGKSGSEAKIHRLISSHRCAGTPKNGCLAKTPVKLVVLRSGRLVHLSLRPRYETLSLGGGQTETAMLIGIGGI